MPGIEPVDVAGAGGSGEPATDATEEIFYRALEAGLSFKVTMGNVLTLTPLLTIEEAELDKALDILEMCIGEVGQVASRTQN